MPVHPRADVTEADRTLYLTLLDLAKTNISRRAKGKPVIDALDLIAQHRISAARLDSIEMVRGGQAGSTHPDMLAVSSADSGLEDTAFRAVCATGYLEGDEAREVGRAVAAALAATTRPRDDFSPCA